MKVGSSGERNLAIKVYGALNGQVEKGKELSPEEWAQAVSASRKAIKKTGVSAKQLKLANLPQLLAALHNGEALEVEGASAAVPDKPPAEGLDSSLIALVKEKIASDPGSTSSDPLLDFFRRTFSKDNAGVIPHLEELMKNHPSEWIKLKEQLIKDGIVSSEAGAGATEPAAAGTPPPDGTPAATPFYQNTKLLKWGLGIVGGLLAIFGFSKGGKGSLVTGVLALVGSLVWGFWDKISGLWKNALPGASADNTAGS